MLIVILIISFNGSEKIDVSLQSKLTSELTPMGAIKADNGGAIPFFSFRV